MALGIEYGFEPNLDCFSSDLTDEEFYSSQTSSISTPGKDIWSKFDIEFEDNGFYPTPPLSPVDPIDTGGGGKHMNLGQTHGERLSQVLASLDDEPIWMTQSFSLTPENIKAVSKNIEKPWSSSTEIKQDFMWSSWKRHLQDSQQAAMDKQNVKECKTPTMQTDIQNDCVDPAAIFPYPLSETKLDFDFGCPATPSDSEEEVDVVTVATIDEHPKPSIFEDRLHTKVIVKEVKKEHLFHKMSSTPPHDYAKQKQPKHTRFIIRNSKRSYDSSDSHSSSKRRKYGNNVDMEELKKALQKLNKDSKKTSVLCRKNTSRLNSRGSSRSSSHPSSDSEDSERRVNHNVLERKRRDDLRHAFFKLRDQVPDLQMQERAAKVVILKKAREYVQKLRHEELERVHAKRALEDEHRRLLRKLRRLEDQYHKF